MKKLLCAVTLYLMGISACALFIATKSGHVQSSNLKYYLRSYQIQLHMDTLWLYDADKLVGVHIDRDTGMIRHGTYIDSLIWADNQ